ncbi:hypothetical protein [Kocuria atrinae]|uniref:Uncharacterized protein n=1 Tax=Kocuria atrinae TaxID=592377 RepID=A0ABP5J8N2_9MICC|nr:hypothetical protein [Kocuria sp.]
MAHRPSSTRATIRWKGVLVAVAGACLIMANMNPAHPDDNGLQVAAAASVIV